MALMVMLHRMKLEDITHKGFRSSVSGWAGDVSLFRGDSVGRLSRRQFRTKPSAPTVAATRWKSGRK